jgi:hypothetical protein
MLFRTLLMSLLALACGFFVSASRADNPSSADQSETVDLSTSHTYSFELTLRVDDATPAFLKKLLGSFRVVEFRVLTTNGLGVKYLVRIFYLGNKQELRAKILREYLPRGHPERVEVEGTILRLDPPFPEKTK